MTWVVSCLAVADAENLPFCRQFVVVESRIEVNFRPA